MLVEVSETLVELVEVLEMLVEMSEMLVDMLKTLVKVLEMLVEYRNSSRRNQVRKIWVLKKEMLVKILII